MGISEHGGDPFGTSELRRRVLAAWADSPARFRADANTEEDFALGGYRDRAVVELAQNAADAARRAGVRGRLRLALRDAELTAANTGAPLTSAGVESLSTLRASAKRDERAEHAGVGVPAGGPVRGLPTDEDPTRADTTEDPVGNDPARGGRTANGSTENSPALAADPIGRFGVGFTALVALSHDITIASHDGAVRWSHEWALQTVTSELPGDGGYAELAVEVERRSGHVPLMRLPFPTVASPPAGYDTVVTAVLRDADAHAAVVRMLDQTGDSLLLALPDLDEVEIDVDGDVRALRRAEPDTTDGDVVIATTDRDGTRQTRWRVAHRSGTVAPGALRDRPTEERERVAWSLTWAVPVGDDGAARPLPEGVGGTVHSPTPSDTPLTVPALLIGTFPLSPDRRHVAMDPPTPLLLAEAAAAYADLLTRLAFPTNLDLVPSRLSARGDLDARLHAELAERLPHVPFLRTVGGTPVRPGDAVLLAGGGEVTAALADLLPTALPGDTDPRNPALAQLGVRRLGLADLADLLADHDAPPTWWRRLYAALREAGGRGADLTELGALPVPLADGRLVRGPRGLLLPDSEIFASGELASGGLAPEDLAPLGVRVVHPEATDPLLERLGASPASERAILTDPRVRAAVENSLDADDPDAIAEPVLDLVSASGVTVAEAPWLAELALRDVENVYCPAGELLLPDSPLREIFVADAPFGILADDLVERYDPETFQAVGVLFGFLSLHATDVTLDRDGEDGLDELALDAITEWVAAVVARLGDPDLPPTVPELRAIRDLEFVREDRWDRALALLTAPGPRAAITEPTRVVTADGRAVDVPSYTAWWLGRGARLDDRRPVELRTADADPALAGLYDPAPDELDADVAAALGVRTSLAELLAEPDGPDELLERLADDTRSVSRSRLRRLLVALAALPPDRVTPPRRVRALLAAGPTGDGSPLGDPVVVADADATLVVDAPDLLPLLAGRPVLVVPPERAPALADVLDLPLASEELTGKVTSAGEPRKVPDVAGLFVRLEDRVYRHHDTLVVDGTPMSWRYVDGQIHATGDDGLARGLAWATGRWEWRHVLAAALRDPDHAARLLDEADLDAEG